MVNLIVTVDKLNKRKVIPRQLPDQSNILGVVRKNFEFVGEEVVNVPNPSLGKWFKDRDGHYYWGGGVALRTTTSGHDWWMDSLALPSIWSNYKEFGANAKIAVLDSGYNTKNTDLSNGVKDSGVFYKAISGSVSINDSFGHGSHCASLIGGRNKKLVTGCAPECELYIAKICPEGSVASFSIIVDAIEWAIKKSVDVISISYGGESGDGSLEAAISKAYGAGILVVASIGDKIPNSTNAPCYPAMYPNCLAVGASDANRQISSLTIQNAKIEINAPGERIMGYQRELHLEPLSGTSQASAIVSGICALVISHHKHKKLAYTVQDIRDLVTQNPNDGNAKIISPIKIFKKF